MPDQSPNERRWPKTIRVCPEHGGLPNMTYFICCGSLREGELVEVMPAPSQDPVTVREVPGVIITDWTAFARWCEAQRSHSPSTQPVEDEVEQTLRETADMLKNKPPAATLRACADRLAVMRPPPDQGELEKLLRTANAEMERHYYLEAHQAIRAALAVLADGAEKP